MAVRALQGLILCLAVVAGVEVGYLSRPPAPEPRVIFSEAAPAPAPSVPACASAEPAPVVVAAEPTPAPRRRPRNRRETAGPIPATGSVADCALNGGPLCGMPE